MATDGGLGKSIKDMTPELRTDTLVEYASTCNRIPLAALGPDQPPTPRPPTPAPAFPSLPVAPPASDPTLSVPPAPSGSTSTAGEEQQSEEGSNPKPNELSDDASVSKPKVVSNNDDEDNQEQQKNVELEDEKVTDGPAKGTGKRRGNPGNFTGTRLQYLEESLPAYVALPSRSKERELWMRDFVPAFKELFPLDDYPMPNPKGLAPLEELSQETLDAMDSKDRDLHNRKVKRREAGPDARYTQSIKNWFVWRSTPYRQKDDAAVKKLLKELDQDFEAPRKRSLDHFVMSHPDHKEEVKQMSAETGSKDRLANRRAAAKKYLEEMSEEDRQKVDDACQQEYELAMEQWNAGDEELTEEEKNRKQAQASFGGAIQPILDSIRRVTGLSVVLFAGEWKGGDTFSSIQLESCAEGARNLSAVQPKVYAAFGQTFLAWLVDAKRAEKPKNLEELEAMPRSNALEELMKLVSNPFGSHANLRQSPTDPSQSSNIKSLSSLDATPIDAIPAIPTSKPREVFPPMNLQQNVDSEGDATSSNPSRKKASKKAKKGGEDKPALKKTATKTKKKGKGKGRAGKQKEREESSEDDEEERAFAEERDGGVDAHGEEEVNERNEEEERKRREEEELEAVKNSEEASAEEYAKMTYDERMAYGQLRKKYALWKAFGSLNPSLTAYIAGGELTARPKPQKRASRTQPTELTGPPRRSSRRNLSSKSYAEPPINKDKDELEEDEPDDGKGQTAGDEVIEKPNKTVEPIIREQSTPPPSVIFPSHHQSDSSVVNSVTAASTTSYVHPLLHPDVWKLALAFAESDESFPVLEKQLQQLLGPLYSIEALQPLTAALFAAETDVSAAVRNLTELRDRYLTEKMEGIGAKALEGTTMQVDGGIEGVGSGGEETLDGDERKTTNEERDPTTSSPSPHCNNGPLPHTAVIQSKPSFDISDPLGHEESRDVSDPFGMREPSTSRNAFLIPPVEAFEDFKSSSFTEDSKAHIKEYMDHLLDKDRGQEWKATVMKWVAMEERWVDLKVKPQSLPTGTRPDGFDVWSKRGREKRAAGLKIPNNISYEDLRRQWGLYWSDINPEWRRREGGKVMMDLKDVEGDWSEFELPGRDGLVLPLVFLRWWSELAPETAEAKSEWVAALENVYFAYNCVFTKSRTSTEEAAAKRKATDEGEEPPPLKRRGLRT
ncbi:SERTA domain-containing protein 3 [Marasmius crinis-equi]|uniref:SERTA domain-containing protein 3 n=1 Tax=Marasmius crinis-equi TaxID=585013 RepID=A0ABR3EWM5_9AGAR